MIGLCAGYQASTWRAKQLADHVFKWIPYVALTEEEQLEFNLSNWEDLISHAAAKIYKTEKTKARGEIGEILLHIACLLNLGVQPLICKLVLKTSSNETVKGFDGVHLLLKADGSFKILLGESKIYSNPRRGISEAVDSLKKHILPEFLDTEKAMLLSHIPHSMRSNSALLNIFRRQTSSDTLLKNAIFPVLISYNSDTAQKHTRICESFEAEIRQELEYLREYFAEECGANIGIEIILIFIPLATKQAVIARFDQKLQAYQ